MKQHLIFCCCSGCKLVEMKAQAIKLLRKRGHDSLINLPEGTIEHGDEKWKFLIEFNHDPNRLYGSIVTTWRACNRAVIHPAIMEYLKTHTGRE